MLAAHDKGLAMPAAMVGISIAADMTSSGSFYAERQHLDPVITLEMARAMAANYSADHDRRDRLALSRGSRRDRADRRVHPEQDQRG